MTPKELLVYLVKEHNGLKGTQLGAEFAQAVHRDKMAEVPEGFDIAQALDELAKTGDLVELEYVVPGMEYRVKSFYMPKGTMITGYYMPKGNWVVK